MKQYWQKTTFYIFGLLSMMLWVAQASETMLDVPNIHDAMEFSDVESSVQLKDPNNQPSTNVNQVTVEPIVVLGIHSLYGVDFSAALEAMSIANYDAPVVYPVYASSLSKDLTELYESGQPWELLEKYQWSKLIINESDYVLRNTLFSTLDAVVLFKTKAAELQTEFILLQAPDSIYRHFDQLSSREDQAVVNGQKIADLVGVRFIPAAHLLARLKQEHQINVIADNNKELSIEGLWAMAAIVYMGLENKRPANPNFSRLYEDLQELVKPFTQIEVSRRLHIIDTAWEEYKRYNRLKN